MLVVQHVLVDLAVQLALLLSKVLIVLINCRYDVENYQRIEKLIEKKLDAYPCDEKMALVLLERVTEAQRIAQQQMKEEEKKGKKGKGRDVGDEEDGVMDSFKSRKTHNKKRRN